MGRNWMRNYRTTGWGNLEAKGNSMYSIGGCALARSTLRAIERGDASVGGVRPVAAPAVAAGEAAAPAAPAKLPPSAPANAPAPATSALGAGWTPLVAVVAVLAALAGLWRFALRGGRAR